MTADLLALVLRTLGFVGLFQACGALFFITIFGTFSDPFSARVRQLALIAAGTAAVCFAAQQMMEAARFAGALSGLFDPGLLRLAWDSPSGLAQLLRLSGLALVFAGLIRASPRAMRVAAVGAVTALLSFLISGHTSVHPLRPVLGTLLAVHLFVAAFWFGSLLPLQFVIQHEARDRAAAIVQRFSAIAGWVVPLILAAGVAMILLLAPSLSVLRQPYGQLLIVKIAAFAMLMVLAAYNRWRLVPMMAVGHAVALRRLRRSIATEIVLIAAVLAVTAALTLFFSPER